MFTILVVAPPAEDVDGLASRHPSVEILRAHTTDEAVEKLGRNRRIDAVLILSGETIDAAGLIREIREENPAPPTLFAEVAAGARPPAGARRLDPGPPGALLKRVVDTLEA